MITLFQLGIRAAVCLAATLLLLGLGDRFLGLSFRVPEDAGVMDGMAWALSRLGWAAAISVVWLWFLGRPVVEWLGEKLGGLWLPSDAGFEWTPQYSIAEARAKEGRYEEAIQEFRRYSLQYPEEITPYLRIADLQLAPLKNPQAAMEELRMAAAKARTAQAYGLVYFRLAELHVSVNGDVSSALECLREVQRRHPRTPQAKAAIERAERLLERTRNPRPGE